MPDLDPVTLGEVARGLSEFKAEIRADLKAIDDRLLSSVVNKDYYNVREQSVLTRLTALETVALERSRFYRSLMGGVIVALIAAAASLIATLVH